MSTEAPLYTYESCNLCPRKCGIDRTSGKVGFCGQTSALKVARAALHFWEEPIISGTRGSGTVFFSGCNLKCVYCQNHEISTRCFGKEIRTERLSEIFLELQEQGSHNINLVTPAMFIPSIREALDMCSGSLHIPIVYNCGGYERTEIVDLMSDRVSIWLPDFKYAIEDTAWRLSMARDYKKVALCAIAQMIKVAGAPVLDENGLLKSGVVVRHLILPGKRTESIEALSWLMDALPKDNYYLSLMSQYTPPEHLNKENTPDKSLLRKLTNAEYESVVESVLEAGFNEDLLFTQERSSATMNLRPAFNLEGV